jgi:hypothetical protein
MKNFLLVSLLSLVALNAAQKVGVTYDITSKELSPDALTIKSTGSEVARSLAGRFLDLGLDIREKGATTALTNNTSYIESAIAAVPANGTVVIPEGIYKINETIDITVPVRINGRGTIKENYTGNILRPMIMVNGVGASGTIIENITIEGIEDASTWTPYVTSDAFYKAGIVVTNGANNVTVRNVTFIGKSTGIKFESVAGFTLDSCVFTNSWLTNTLSSYYESAAINVRTAQRGQIRGNRTYGYGQSIVSLSTSKQIEVSDHIINIPQNNGIYGSSSYMWTVENVILTNIFGGAGIKIRGSQNLVDGVTITKALQGVFLTPYAALPTDISVDQQSIDNELILKARYDLPAALYYSGYGNIVRNVTGYNVDWELVRFDRTTSGSDTFIQHDSIIENITGNGVGTALAGVSPILVYGDAIQLKNINLVNSGNVDNDAAYIHIPTLTVSGRVYGSRDIVISGGILDSTNTIINGIVLANVTNAIVSNMLVKNTTNGIKVTASSKVTVHNNSFQGIHSSTGLVTGTGNIRLSNGASTNLIFAMNTLDGDVLAPSGTNDPVASIFYFQTPGGSSYDAFKYNYTNRFSLGKDALPSSSLGHILTLKEDTEDAPTTIHLRSGDALGRTSAGSQLTLDAYDASNFVGSYPSDYTTTKFQKKGVIGANSTSEGWLLHIPFTGQVFRIFTESNSKYLEYVRTNLTVPGIVYATNLVSGDINGGNVTANASAYGVGWDGSTNVPTRNDVYDQIQGMIGGINPKSTWIDYDDFVGSITSGSVGKMGWRHITSSGGFVSGGGATAGRPGTIRLRTSTATGQAGIGLNSSATSYSVLGFGGGPITNTFIVNINTLADVTDEYKLRIGVLSRTGDTDTAEPANGVYFLYDRTNSVNWQIVCTQASTPTAATSSTAVATGWHVFDVVVNAAGTSASFFLDGSELANSPIASNIPTTVSIAPVVHQERTAGTANRDIDVDLWRIVQTFTTPR